MKSWLRGTEYFPSAKQRIKNSFIAGEIRLQKNTMRRRKRDWDMTDSDGRSWVVGRNQSLRIIRAGKAKRVILAKDAEPSFTAKILSEARKAGVVEIDTSYTSKQLAEKAGIAVPTAVITEY